MQVTLIASATTTIEGFTSEDEFSLDPVIESLGMRVDDDTNDADSLAEFAGRACYQSFHKPNAKTRSNRDYIANILRQQHESVLEHATATFYVTGISRALTHELIRHRHLNFSQLSQRFVDGSESEFVLPPAYRIDYETDSAEVQARKEEISYVFWNNVQSSVHDYERLVELGELIGLPRKQNREAARSVMPNATETRIVVTGNMRAWRDVLKRRFSVHADAEICEFAGEVLKHLRTVVAPSIFQDFPEVPFE